MDPDSSSCLVRSRRETWTAFAPPPPYPRVPCVCVCVCVCVKPYVCGQVGQLTVPLRCKCARDGALSWRTVALEASLEYYSRARRAGALFEASDIY